MVFEIKIYDHLDEILMDEKFKIHPAFRHAYYARDLMKRLNFEEEEYTLPLERAMRACRSLGIPDNEHFCHVYCFGQNTVTEDYSLSDFGTYLFIINCDPSNPVVARAQLFH